MTQDNIIRCCELSCCPTRD